MLNKRVTVETPSHLEGELISSLFIAKKKDRSNRPVITLKHLNQFKMEGLHCVQNILKKGDYMCKLDLKYAHLSVPLNNVSRIFFRFLWSGKLYEFLCLCFGLGPAPRIFTKLLKIPVSVLHRLNILIINYLDKMLLTGHSVEEMLMARDFLQQLEFVLNLKKSVLTPTQKVDFLGVTLDSFIMTLSLPEKKVSKPQKQYLELLQKTQVLILELTKLIGLLSSIIQAVLLAQVRTTTNTSIKTQEPYCKKSDSKQKFRGRTPRVDTKFENLQ